MTTARFWRANAALFIAGFATFAALYDVQPLLPTFSRVFGVVPAAASLAISATTSVLAFALLVVGSLAERWGRKMPMAAALVVSSLLTIACSIVHDFDQLVVVRCLEGLALAGLPALAMAYISEEVEPRALGLAMGLYIGGTGLGGMFGRLIVGFVAEAAGWRFALVTIGVLGLGCAALFAVLLPVSQNFRPHAMTLPATGRAFLGHVRDAGLPWLYATAFLLMGAFVTDYNYLGYRLEAAPYRLSPSAVGAVFTVYLAGVVASAVMGRLADALGRRNVLWVSIVVMLGGALATAQRPLWTIVAGMALFTFGFFGAHAVASGWVGRRALVARAHASSLYLFAYYMGSSILGWAFGGLFGRGGWDAITLGVALAIGAALVIALGPLRRISPIAPAITET